MSNITEVSRPTQWKNGITYRRRMGRVVPDPANPGMYRFLKSGDFSDISNLSWAKDAVLAQAIRKVAYEQLANDPSKCPVKPGSQKQFRYPCVFLRRLSSGPNETPPKYPYLTATSTDLLAAAPFPAT